MFFENNKKSHFYNSIFSILFLNLLSATVFANSGGITGHSGKQGTTCSTSGCHSGADYKSSLSIDGVVAVEPGEKLDLSLLLKFTPPASVQAAMAGINIAVSDGTLAAGTDTKVVSGELTHDPAQLVALTNNQKNWGFSWTAPNTFGDVTLFACAEAVDRNFTNGGDDSSAACIKQVIKVQELVVITPEPDPEPTDNSIRYDSDGDGKADILWRNHSTGQNWLWTMNGFDIKKSSSINTISLDWEIGGRGDVDGDGKSDILWRNKVTGRNWVYLMDGSIIKSSKELNYIADLNWKIAEVADFNGDGKADIFWHNQETGQTWMYLLDGIKITVSKTVLTINDLDWQVAASGDVNGDGNADIIWRHQISGENKIFTMSGSDITSQYILNTIPLDWNITGAGDLNGDGTDDIVWRNGSGLNWAYLMGKGQITSSKQINTIADKDWHMKMIADLNGDGKADILWRHQVTGKTYMYLMDGHKITASGYSTTISMNWFVVAN